MKGKEPRRGGADSHHRNTAGPPEAVADDRLHPAGPLDGERTAGGGESAGNELIAGIRRDAEAEAERLLEEARKAAEDRLEAVEVQRERIVAEARAKADGQAKSVRDQATSAMRMEGKRTSLKIREEALRKVLQSARERLSALAGEAGSSRDYRPVLLGWIVEAAIGLNVPKAFVNASARERELLDRDLLEAAEGQIKELTGREVSLEAAQGDPLVGQGVVLRSADGRLEFNNQVSTRLLRHQSEVRKIVFEALDR